MPNENLPNPSAAKGGSQTMVRVTLVVCKVLPGGTEQLI